jgi:hypothetical protein
LVAGNIFALMLVWVKVIVNTGRET